jgi:hypothetical protein
MDWNPERVLTYRKGEPFVAKPTSVARQRVRVGIWDLNAAAGSLPRLLDLVEESQSYFSFYSVEAPYQSGLTLTGPHIAREWQELTHTRMRRAEAELNVSAERIFRASDPVLKALPIEWIVVVVKSMIADTRNAWLNLFATSRRNVVLVSTFELRAFAAEGGRPFESALLGVAISALIAAMVPEVEYNTGVPTGSIFDFCKVRRDIIMAIRDPHIDAANRSRIPPDMLAHTEKILKVIKRYKGQVTSSQIRRQLKILRRTPRTEENRASIFTAPKKPRNFSGAFPSLSFSETLKKLALSLKISSTSGRRKPETPPAGFISRKKPRALKLPKRRADKKATARHK